MKNIYEKNKATIIIWLTPLLFLFVSLFTLSDYGLNWDSAKHYNKGQAYLNYILSGSKNFQNLPSIPSLDKDIQAGPQDWESYSIGQGRLYGGAIWEGWEGDKRSFYQTPGLGYQAMIDGFDGFSHPAGNDLSAALTNYIFYQKLGILGDYESHNLFIILISFVSVLAVSYFAYHEFGAMASLLAGFFYGFYPLFFAEAHFNIKDPVVTAYITLTIISFYYAVKNKSYKLLFLASVFAGLGLSTKLNIVFAPVIAFPWLLIYLVKKRKSIRKNIRFYLSFIFIPAVALSVFILTWPYLWHDILSGIAEMLLYYLDIGQGGNNLTYEPYIYFGINFYPLYFILTTTPLSMLLLFLFGFATSLYKLIKKKKIVYLLIVSWFLIPILRVSTPSATIYGGVRQIMEYIPAMALLSAMGGQLIYKQVKSKCITKLMLGGAVLFMGVEMVVIHPNQNVYFNQLVGGLSGAAERQIPYWGNSFGNAYLQGIEWLNQNVEPNAKVANIWFSDSELPFQKLRSDLSLCNCHWSGNMMQKEYAIELFGDFRTIDRYDFAYYDNYLTPIYELEEQGAPILKIWKNSPEYLNREVMQRKFSNIAIEIDPFQAHLDKERVVVDLGAKKSIDLLLVRKDDSCELSHADNIVFLANDLSKEWERVYEVLGAEILPKNSVVFETEGKLTGSEDVLSLPIANKKAQYIIIEFYIEDSCVYKNPKIEVYGSD